MGVVTIQIIAGNRIRTPGSVFRSGTFFNENLKFLVFQDFPLHFPLHSIKGRARRGPAGGFGQIDRRVARQK